MELKNSLREDLDEAAAYHGHLCAGQFIGVRMARYACSLLGLSEPRLCRDLFTFVETDRCLADAVSVVTGCKLGKRRLRHIDYGKSAASFLNAATGEALRISSKGWMNVPKDADLYAVFEKLSDEALFKVEKVRLSIPQADLPGPPREKTVCQTCGEYVTDGRHILKEGRTLCRSCAHGAYWE
ncbi:MAG: FmdE family protein [Spirochaetaceae bacterium]|jgi:formylmethanofuran dehydrogenase subunit E|nr:FmdE family protein [Spirochaetaceae bacterium]